MDEVNPDTTGDDGMWFDPVWRLTIGLTPLERELLRSWWVRRLAFVSHAGAASITSTQAYSRLEHSLGVLALVAHFAPEDYAARATALLHDVGHLPFSHTLEGIAGLEHHAIGRERIRELAPVLERHGIAPATVIAIDEGAIDSPLRAQPGAMKLDHLDSFARSAQARGRTTMPPPEILARCRLVGGTVDTDAETAAELVRLVIGEARAQRAASNVVPVAVLRDLVARALEADCAAFSPVALAAMTDDELWAALLISASTRERALAFRRDPRASRLLEDEGDTSRDGDRSQADGEEIIENLITRGYLSLPTVNGVVITNSEVSELERELPARYRIAHPAKSRQPSA